MDYLFGKNQGHLLTNYHFVFNKKTQQKKLRSWGQTVDKTTAKPVSVVNNQEKPIICNKALSRF